MTLSTVDVPGPANSVAALTVRARLHELFIKAFYALLPLRLNSARKRVPRSA